MQMLNSEQRKRLAVPPIGRGCIPPRLHGTPGEETAPSAVFARTKGNAAPLDALALPPACFLPSGSASPLASAVVGASVAAATAGCAPAATSSANSAAGEGTSHGAMRDSFSLPAIVAASCRPAPRRLAGTAGRARSMPTADSAHLMSPPAQALAKRAFDLCFALAFLTVALPFIILVAVALQVASPGPVFFVQQRVGRHGAMFGCIKLRTMRRDADAALAHLLVTCPESRREWEADHKLRRDPRVSAVGRIVRKLSLDELPQLINIIRGEMSVVGPRPIVAAEIPRYGAAFADYCAVKPGLTGLWQVSGRNDTTYAQRVELDSHYARRANFWFDCGIVLRTVPAVVLGRGCY